MTRAFSRFRMLAVALAAALALATMPAGGASAPAGPATKSAARRPAWTAPAGAPARLAGGVYVRARAGADARDVEASVAALGGELARRYPDGSFVVTAHGAAGDLVSRIAAIGGVDAVSKVHTITVTAVPNDPLFPQQWGLTRIAAPTAWDSATGSGTVVAVIDSGVDYTHPDLASKVILGPNYVHTATVVPPMDVDGHGTHVAGIIAAVTDNATMVAGTAPGARILAIKVIEGVEGNDADAGAAIRYAVDNGAKVINLSFGLTLAAGESSPPMEDACAYARERGVIVVAAAGNTGNAQLFYPAAYPGVFGVAASDASDIRASFSSYGPGVVDVTAPGVLILSTWPGASTEWLSGTSMSAPFASGAAAVLLEASASADATSVTRQLEDTAVDIGPSGFDVYTGHGRIDMAAMLAPAPRDAFEPDDTPAQADAPGHGIAHGGVAAHSSVPVGDADHMRVEAVAGRTYRFDTLGLCARADTHVTVLAADGLTVLAENDDASPGSRASLIETSVATTGPVYVRNTDGGLGGHYRLRMTDTTAYHGLARLAGADRFASAVSIAERSWPGWAGVTDVVIASGEDRSLVDALSAGGLSGVYRAPLLLTRGTILPAATRDALDAMPVGLRVHIVGGTSAVSASVASALAARPRVASVDRVHGSDRYGTARAVATRMRAVRGTTPPGVLIANGADPAWASDALCLSAVSAATGCPLLLVSRYTVPLPTTRALLSQGSGPVIVGGNASAVSGTVYRRVGGDARWAGATRYHTARAIADGAIAREWLSADAAGVVGGLPDALSGASAIGGRERGAILVTPPTRLWPADGAFLDAHQATLSVVRVLGGPVAVSETVRAQIAAVLRD